MKIKDQVIIVTGASMGIGRAVAELLALEGARVVLAARKEVELKKLAETLPGSFAVCTDMTAEKDIDKVIPIMRQQGGGMIVNISSMVSKAYYPYLGAYASTKYALNALSLTARAELEKDNIVVNIMLPGMTETDFGKNALKSDAVAKSMESRRRPGMPTPDSAEYIATRVKHAIETGAAETLAHER
jgi:short-subunit dehydrogenase